MDKLRNMRLPRGNVFWEGVRDGTPIGLGYFAVAFALGLAARGAGLTAFQGFLASLLNNASAGEYAGFSAIREGLPYWQTALVTLVANARYLLMSCALSQRFAPETPFYHRIFIGFDLTDELFGITVARPGPVVPRYSYGAMLMALPGWSLGTMAGIMASHLLPERLVDALGVALFGMFLAIIIPPARKSRVIAGLVAASFGASYAFARLPGLRELSGGTRTVILTLLLAGLAAAFFPAPEAEKEA